MPTSSHLMVAQHHACLVTPERLLPENLIQPLVAVDVPAMDVVCVRIKSSIFVLLLPRINRMLYCNSEVNLIWH